MRGSLVGTGVAALIAQVKTGSVKRCASGPTRAPPWPAGRPCSATRGFATDPNRQACRIDWRAGLDLNPVDLANPAEVAWLEALVRPEQTDRLGRLRAPIMIVAEQRPRLVKGDLRTDVAALAREAPKDATLVIFHTAVLAYISPAAEREEFARSVGSLCDYWVANEAPQVFPDIARRVDREGPRGSFLLSVNGAPMAWADPHGAWLDWVATAPSQLTPYDACCTSPHGRYPEISACDRAGLVARCQRCLGRHPGRISEPPGTNAGGSQRLSGAT